MEDQPDDADSSLCSRSSCSNCSPSRNLHHNIELRNSAVHGRGLFAIGKIAKGDTVWVNNADGPMEMYYPKYTFDEIEHLPPDARDCIIRYGSQINENTLHGPVSEQDIFLDYSNFFNHSCDPNVLPLNENMWVAVKDIKAGHEVTIDYVTFDCNKYSDIPKCECGAKNCRKRLSKDDYKDKTIQARYRGHFVQFIQEKIELEFCNTFT